jgi:exodeoxyribonuclease V gamma subunit
MVARDTGVAFAPLDAAAARAVLGELVALWRANLDQPLPVACRTALAQVQNTPAALVYDGSDQGDAGPRPERDDPALARLWPDFAALSSHPDWPEVATHLYGPLVEWIGASVRTAPFDVEAGA